MIADAELEKMRERGNADVYRLLDEVGRLTAEVRRWRRANDFKRGWISAKEKKRLPERGVDVLVFTYPIPVGCGVLIGSLHDRPRRTPFWFGYGWPRDYTEAVTHWMPMPAPPED